MPHSRRGRLRSGNTTPVAPGPLNGPPLVGSGEKAVASLFCSQPLAVLAFLVEQRSQPDDHSFRRCQLGGGDVLAPIRVQGLDDDTIVPASKQSPSFLVFGPLVGFDADLILVALFGDLLHRTAQR